MSQTGIGFKAGGAKNLLGKNFVEQSLASRDRELDSLTGDSTLNGEHSVQAAILLSPTKSGFVSGKADDRITSSAIQSKAMEFNKNILIQGQKGSPQTFGNKKIREQSEIGSGTNTRIVDFRG